MRPRGHNTTPAYTLIELVAVIAILAVLVAVAAPRLSSSTQNYRAALAATEVASLVERVRADAAARRAEVTITFKPGTAVITIDGVPDPLTGVNPYEVSLAEDPFRASVATANFGGDEFLTISAWGQVSSSGAVTITAGTLTREVTVATGSGRAEVTPQ